MNFKVVIKKYFYIHNISHDYVYVEEGSVVPLGFSELVSIFWIIVSGSYLLLSYHEHRSRQMFQHKSTVKTANISSY